MAELESPYLGVNIAHFSAAMKTRYLPGMHQQFSSENLVYRIFEKSYEYVSGGEVELSLVTQRSSGFGAVLPEGRIANPHFRGRSSMNFPVRYISGSLMVTGPVMSKTRDAAGAFAEALDTAISDLVEDALHDMDRIFLGDGSGRLAILTDVSQAGIGRFRAREVHDLANQGRTLPHVREGDMVAIVDANDGGNPGTVAFIQEATSGNNSQRFIVTECDPNQKAFTLRPVAVNSGLPDVNPIDLSAAEEGDAIVRVISQRDSDVYHGIAGAEPIALQYTNYHGGTAGGTSADAGAGQKELMGLAGIVAEVNPFYHYDNAGNSDATMDPLGYAGQPLQGVSVGNGYWRSNVNDPYVGTRALDDLLMQEAHDLMEEIGNSELEFLLCSYGIRRAYKALVGPDRRFDKTLDFDLGQRAMDFNEAPMVAERYVSPGRIYFLNRSPFVIALEDDWHWIEEDGAVLYRIHRYNKFAADLWFAGEFCIRRRNAVSYLGSIREF